MVNRRMARDTYQFTVMMLAVSAVLDVVQVVTGFFAKQSQRLRTSHMKLLLASGFVALHASSNVRLRTLSYLLANVTDCKSNRISDGTYC